MAWIEQLFGSLEIADDVRLGKRFGFGGFLWQLAFVASIFVTALFFYLDVYVLGVIGILGSVACFVSMIHRTCRDIRKKQETEAIDREVKNGFSRGEAVSEAD